MSTYCGKNLVVLGDDYASLPVNFSTGIRLSQAPVARDALTALAFGERQVTVQSVLRIMRSRYVELKDEVPGLAQSFRLRLLDGGSDEIDIGELRNFAAGMRDNGGTVLRLGEVLLSLFEQRELRGKAHPSEWSRRFNTVLDIWGWPGETALDSLEYQQVALWYKTVEHLANLDGVCGEIDLRVSAHAVASGRVSAKPRIHRHPIAQYRVLGPLEAVGLSFDHLWILGMQASAWPAPPPAQPFSTDEPTGRSGYATRDFSSGVVLWQYAPRTI